MKQIITKGILVLLMVLSCSMQAQKKTVVGTITGKDGIPLIGASVVIKGTTTGVSTDFDGKYSINASENDTLVISYVGFITQEVTANGKTTINITLLEDANALDEVIVVGYGTQKKSNLSGAISQISSDDVGNQAITSASTMLQGRVAGVQMVQGSSQPGNNAPTFQIRGMGSLRSDVNGLNSATAPLILIDGVEATMDDIHPNDIDTFSILKDASSAAIYGAKGANGVVLVTTKRGKGRAPKVKINSYYGIQSATTTPEMLSPYQFAIMMNEAYTNVGQAPKYSDEIVEAARTGDPRIQNFNFFDEGFRTGAPLINHYFSVTGGSDKVKYMFSTGYQDHEGIVIETNSKRYNFRSNIDVKISDKFRAGFNISGSLVKRSEPNYGRFGPNQFIRDMIRRFPLNPLRYDNGYISGGNTFLGSQSQNIIHPIGLVREGGKNNYRTYRAIPNVYIEFEPIKDLVFKANVSANISEERWTKLRSVMTTSNSETVRTNQNGLGKLEERTNSRIRNVFEFTSRYFKNIGRSNITGLLGYAKETNRYDGLWGSNEEYPYGTLLAELDAGTVNPSVNGTGNESASVSYFARLSYDFDNKYLFTVNVRRDGSSRFGKNTRHGIFPSFSLGWNIAKESFLENSSVINELKPRFSWGILGNDALGNYDHIERVNLNQPYVLGNSLTGGAAITSLSNPNLAWEETTTTDFGVEVTLFNYKLSIETDYYIKKTEGVLASPPIPATLGNLSAPVQNISQVENKGWEVLLNYSDKIGDDFNYGLSFNWSHNDNKILKLDTEFIRGNKTIAREGESIYSFYGHRTLGIFQTDQQAQDVATYGKQPGGASVRAGDLIWEDTNGDGIVDSKDRVVIGNPNIRNNYGFTLNMEYKGFDFRTTFQGVLGRDVEEGVFGFDGRANMNLTTKFLDRWTPENTDTDVPRVARGYKYNTSLFVGPSISNAIIDASYLRMKHIEFGYSIPKEVISKIGFSKFRIYVSGENVLTFTDYSDGFDPEDSFAFNNTNDSYPHAKTYSLGVNLEF